MLNKKGFTVVELIMSFAFVSILSASLFAVIINYKNKQQDISVESKLLSFKSKVTIDIQNDIQKKILDNINYCVDGSGNRSSKCVVLSFKNGESKTLEIREETKVDTVGDSQFTYKLPYILYGDVRYMPPDASNIEVKNDFFLENTTLDDDIENKMVLYKIRILIEHRDIEGDMDISIVALGTQNIQEGVTPSYETFSVGDKVTVQVNGQNQYDFNVIKDSSGYNDHIVALLDHNLNVVNFNENVNSGNTYIGSNIKSNLDFLTSDWYNSTVVRLITAEEVGYLVNACPDYRKEDASDLNISSAPNFIYSSSYWTMSPKLYNGENNGKKVWYVNGGSKKLTDDSVNVSYGLRPLIEIHKKYITGKTTNNDYCTYYSYRTCSINAALGIDSCEWSNWSNWTKTEVLKSDTVTEGVRNIRDVQTKVINCSFGEHGYYDDINLRQ